CPPIPLLLPPPVPAPPATYPLSLHAALPISRRCVRVRGPGSRRRPGTGGPGRALRDDRGRGGGGLGVAAGHGESAEGDRSGGHRSEEHTSELQSRENLVCRLLLEKKNTNQRI